MRLLAALAATALASASFLEDTQSHYIAQRKLIEGDPTSSRNCPRCPGLASPRTNPEVTFFSNLRGLNVTQPVYNGMTLYERQAELIVFQAPCTSCTYKLGEILLYLYYTQASMPPPPPPVPAPGGRRVEGTEAAAAGGRGLSAMDGSEYQTCDIELEFALLRVDEMTTTGPDRGTITEATILNCSAAETLVTIFEDQPRLLSIDLNAIIGTVGPNPEIHALAFFWERGPDLTGVINQGGYEVKWGFVNDCETDSLASSPVSNATRVLSLQEEDCRSLTIADALHTYPDLGRRQLQEDAAAGPHGRALTRTVCVERRRLADAISAAGAEGRRLETELDHEVFNIVAHVPPFSDECWPGVALTGIANCTLPSASPTPSITPSPSVSSTPLVCTDRQEQLPVRFFSNIHHTQGLLNALNYGYDPAWEYVGFRWGGITLTNGQRFAIRFSAPCDVAPCTFTLTSISLILKSLPPWFVHPLASPFANVSFHIELGRYYRNVPMSNRQLNSAPTPAPNYAPYVNFQSRIVVGPILVTPWPAVYTLPLAGLSYTLWANTSAVIPGDFKLVITPFIGYDFNNCNADLQTQQSTPNQILWLLSKPWWASTPCPYYSDLLGVDVLPGCPSNARGVLQGSNQRVSTGWGRQLHNQFPDVCVNSDIWECIGFAPSISLSGTLPCRFVNAKLAELRAAIEAYVADDEENQRRALAVVAERNAQMGTSAGRRLNNNNQVTFFTSPNGNVNGFPFPWAWSNWNNPPDFTSRTPDCPAQYESDLTPFVAADNTAAGRFISGSTIPLRFLVDGPGTFEILLVFPPPCTRCNLYFHEAWLPLASDCASQVTITATLGFWTGGFGTNYSFRNPTPYSIGYGNYPSDHMPWDNDDDQDDVLGGYQPGCRTGRCRAPQGGFQHGFTPSFAFDHVDGVYKRKGEESQYGPFGPGPGYGENAGVVDGRFGPEIGGANRTYEVCEFEDDFDWMPDHDYKSGRRGRWAHGTGPSCKGRYGPFRGPFPGHGPRNNSYPFEWYDNETECFEYVDEPWATYEWQNFMPAPGCNDATTRVHLSNRTSIVNIFVGDGFNPARLDVDRMPLGTQWWLALRLRSDACFKLGRGVWPFFKDPLCFTDKKRVTPVGLLVPRLPRHALTPVWDALHDVPGIYMPAVRVEPWVPACTQPAIPTPSNTPLASATHTRVPWVDVNQGLPGAGSAAGAGDQRPPFSTGENLFGGNIYSQSTGGSSTGSGSSSSSDTSSGLSGGGIAGIVVGAVALAAVVSALTVYAVHRARASSAAPATAATAAPAAAAPAAPAAAPAAAAQPAAAPAPAASP